MRRAVVAVLSMLTCTSAFIIPEDLPTLLSVVYSNIPPIKLGFDTRIGFGFRIGPHADFQTLIEIGPQENTRPIGTGNETFARRRSPDESDIRQYRVTKKEFSPKRERVSESENETYQPNLADILLGRKGKKQMKALFGGIEFKKVPGIDDVKKSSKTTKIPKHKQENSPTRIAVYR